MYWSLARVGVMLESSWDGNGLGIILGFDYGWVWFRVVVGVSIEMGLRFGFSN